MVVEVHEVVSPTGERLGFGELAAAAMALPVPPFEELAFKDEADFRYIGKGNVPITDLHDITTGAAVYGADVVRPGMKFAAVARPPVVGGSVVSYDATAALAVPGVERVVELEGTPAPMMFAPLGGIAVVASNTWAALQGVQLLEIEWDGGRERRLRQRGLPRRDGGDGRGAGAGHPQRGRLGGGEGRGGPDGERAATTRRTWRMRPWSRRRRSPR